MKSPNLRVTAAWLLPVVTIVLAAGIFVADTITDLEIAFPAFYTAIVLLASRFCRKNGVIIVGAGCIGLTLLSDILTFDAAPSEAGVANTVIGLLSIAAATYLAVKFEAEKEAVYEMRSQLAHVTRVATLGEMTTSLAHQVNQPLAAVAINANALLHWLDDRPPNLDEARRNVARIVKDVDRASEVILQVRNLAKSSPPERDWLRMNEIVLSTVALLDREIQQSEVVLQTQLSNELPLLRGDRIQLQQVILNLLLNAIDALSLVSQGQRKLVVSSAKIDTKNALIAVQDSGGGFAPEDFDRLFNAFYSTKPNGMGMGLAISRSIVESHGGQIWAKPNASGGAVFQFTLPIDAG